MSIAVASEPTYRPIRQSGNPMDPFAKAFYIYSNDTWTPNVNLYETAGSYLVCVDLAGVEKDKIEVEVVEQRLKLRGTRSVPISLPDESGAPPPETPPRLRVHLMEIDHGGFTREVELPADVDRAGISATYRNGLLWIEIPRAK